MNIAFGFCLAPSVVIILSKTMNYLKRIVIIYLMPLSKHGH
jgi:hypothetical protein